MKKLALPVLLVLCIVFSATFVSCTKIEAEQEKMLDLTKADEAKSVLSDVSIDKVSVITIEDVEKVIAKAEKLYTDYGKIRLSDDKYVLRNDEGAAMKLSFVKELTVDNYQSSYDMFSEYRLGEYELLLKLMEETFPEAYYTDDNIASDGFLILDLKSTGCKTTGLATGKLLSGENVGEVVVATLGCLYHYNSETEEAVRIFPSNEVYLIEQEFYELNESGVVAD